MFVCINYDFGSFFNEMCIQTRPLDFVVNQNFNISCKKSYFLCGIPDKLEDGAAGMWEKQLCCREAARSHTAGFKDN